jgi:hypothetical protein
VIVWSLKLAGAAQVSGAWRGAGEFKEEGELKFISLLTAKYAKE